MNKLLVLVLATFAGCGIQAQDTKMVSKSLMNRFHSFNTVQVLNGKSTTSLAINTVNGFRFGKFFTGIGTGFDYYFHVTVPLFLEARFDLVKQKATLQVFGNGGISFPFSAQNKKFETQTGPYKTGTLFCGGLDYLAPVGKDAFILGVSFSNKQVNQNVDNYVWDPRTNLAQNIPIKNEYTLNRFAIRIGWMF